MSSVWRRFDLFGQSIEFTFRGNSHYKTDIGAAISLICIILMLALVFMRTSKLIIRDDPLLTTTNSAKEDSNVRLGEQGFMFAVQNVSPRIGVITAILQEMQYTEDLERTNIELADCREFMPGGLHEGKSNNYLFEIERIVSTNTD